MVDIQYATAAIRWGIKKDRKQKSHGKNIMSASATQGGHNKHISKWTAWTVTEWTLRTLSAPQSSTVSVSGTTVMRKYGVSNSFFNTSAIFSSLQPAKQTHTYSWFPPSRNVGNVRNLVNVGRWRNGHTLRTLHENMETKLHQWFLIGQQLRLLCEK